MTVLVHNHADVGVFGHDGVVENTDVIRTVVRRVHARDQVAQGGAVAVGVLVHVPAVGPNREFTLRAAAGFVANAGMGDHEVVHNAVMVRVPLAPVEARVGRVDGVGCVSRHAEDGAIAAHVGAAGAGVVCAIFTFGDRQLHPAVEVTREMIHALGLLEVPVGGRMAGQVHTGAVVQVRAHNADAGCRPFAKEQVLVMGGVEVGHPQGVVVAAGRRVRDLVVQRASDGGRCAIGHALAVNLMVVVEGLRPGKFDNRHQQLGFAGFAQASSHRACAQLLGLIPGCQAVRVGNRVGAAEALLAIEGFLIGLYCGFGISSGRVERQLAIVPQHLLDDEIIGRRHGIGL